MIEHDVDQELERLRRRVASLEQLQAVQEKEVRQQSSQLERSLQELRERAEQLAKSEDALRGQSRIFQAILRGMSTGVVVANEKGKFLLFNPAAESILGIGATDVSPAEWSKRYGCYLPDRVTLFPAEQLPLARAIRGEEVDDEVIFIRHEKRPDGLWLSVTARPLRDEAGALRGGLAVFRDVTEEKRFERRLSAQYAVSRVLAESATLGEATPKILAAICETTNWEVGALWRLDRQDNVLRCVDVWHRPEGNFASFEKATREITFAPGVGLPGSVWAKREPVWCADVLRETNFPRAAAAAEHDLHGAFAFPILFGAEVTGVIEFFSREIRRPDDDLLSMISALGRQIGQFTARRRAEEELRKSRERFELAMLGSGDGVWDWDVETNEVYFSPRWKSMLGYENHEIAHTFDEWEKRLHPEDRARAMATIEAYFAGLTPIYELEHRLQHKDGTYRWILARGVALRDATGKPYRMAGSHTDLTERHQAERALRDSEALYHSLVETLPLNVFRKDLQGRFTFANQLFCKTAGRPLEQLLGKTDFDFYPPALAEKYRQDDRRVFEKKEVLDIVEEHRKPNGEHLYVQVLKTPVYDSKGEVVGTQAIFWDVTDRKLAEEAMQKAREAAESANRAKSVFLANMSHEIRTPMNAIIGMTELLLETELTIEQREYLELVKKSADSLLSVINDVLDFSKVEAGRLDLDTIAFNLRDHLGDTLNTLAPRAYQKGLELACHVSPDVPDALLGDPDRLRQIINNLVGNALKFTKHGEVVVIVRTLQIAEHSNLQSAICNLQFSVRDTGIGVAADKLETIFDPFVQADGSTTRKYGGTGLGLAIAKRLAEMMGGRIWIESAVGEGSTFHFTARFAIQQGRPLKHVPGETASMKGMAVLVVDDNATNRRILDETLSHWQMRPTLCDSGPAALDTLLQAAQAGEPFPLVLIDVHMPQMDGYDLAERIRQQPALAGATLMMLTSGGSPGEGARRRDLGISSYLTKPIKQADLWKAIMQALGMPISQDELLSAPQSTRAGKGLRLRVLLAEDNLVNQQLAVRLLSKRGHKVVVANNGREALAALKTEPFDVVLMDVQMPEMDGYEATAAIRRLEQSSATHVPIIAMTAYAMKGDRERCLEMGMDSYISKPIRAQELFESIETIVPAATQTVGSDPIHAVEEAPDRRHVDTTGQILDEAAALARVGDDRELLAELAQLFLHECPHLLSNIRLAIAEGDPVKLKSAAHNLKGSVDNFAAKRVVEAAWKLEMAGRDGNLTGVQETWRVLEEELERLGPVLASLASERVRE